MSGSTDAAFLYFEASAFLWRYPGWEGFPHDHRIIFLLTDLTGDVAFDNVNPYSTAKMEKDKHITTRPYLLPIRTLNKGSNYVVYHTPHSKSKP
jgi:hypothetical protein